MRIIREDFAGPGGWDEGARLLGLDARIDGVEFDESAAAVARAAGHRRWVADVTCDAVRDRGWPELWGYIASPPCQTFSMAGKGDGRAHVEHITRALRLVAQGWTPRDAVAMVGDAVLDERTVLVLEPMLVIREHLPRWVAMEQVPAVQPIWDAYAVQLRLMGYSVWTGPLHAEQYGVSQTRKRAIFMASLDREVTPPPPTHSRYYPRDPGRLDEGVAKWVSMAEALGEGYGDLLVRSNYGTGGDPAARGERRADEPAATVPEKVGRNKWMPVFNDQSGASYDPEWPAKRPATVVAGREIVQNPGATANRFNGSTKSRNDGVRVTVQEAGILQSFRPDYPWEAAGTKGKQYQRVGDAIPPLLAGAVLGALTGTPFAQRPAEA